MTRRTFKDCQLLTFVRYVWNDNVYEDMLFCEPILRTKSDVIANTVQQFVTKKGLDWKRCVGICTDGAKPMCGKKTGAITQLLKLCPLASWTHCSIHREALATKTMAPELKNVLDRAVLIINFIKSRPLQARLFEILCKEMCRSHTALLFHAEVRWLSRGKVLTRLVELRDEILVFLHERNTAFVEWLCDENFVMRLTYLADIFGKLNDLNLSLQGAGNAHIFSVNDKIRSFRQKLQLWKQNIEAENFDCFETLATFLATNELIVPGGIRTEIVDHLHGLDSNLEIYFKDSMQKCASRMWVATPFQPNQLTGISTQADEQLIDLSEDSTERLNFQGMNLIQFWLSLGEKFSLLSTEAMKILLPFSSSYACEQGFSAMISLKNKYRNRLQLSHSLRLKVSHFPVDVSAVVNTFRKRAHCSH